MSDAVRVADMHHGLVAALVVDDAQAAVDQGDIDGRAVGAHRSVAEPPGAVWASVLDRVVEGVEPRLGYGLVVGGRFGAGFVDSEDTGDSAHDNRGYRTGVCKARRWRA